MMRIKLVFCCLMLLISNIALAGRHSIAREVAQDLINKRFAQFYQDQARIEAERQRATEYEIRKAKQLEEDMLKNLNKQQGENSFKSADDLESEILKNLNKDPNAYCSSNDEFNSEPSLNQDSGKAKTNFASNNYDSSFSNSKPSKKTDPTVAAKKAKVDDLQGFSSMNASEQNASLKEVIASIKSLPNSNKLAADFANDLAKASPELAKKFKEEYEKHNTEHKSKTKFSTTGSSKALIKSNKKGSIKEKYSQQTNTFKLVTKYDYRENQVYPVYTATNKITAIMLEPGEQIIGKPLFGDNIRWQADLNTLDTSLGKQQILAVQNLRANLKTSLIFTTNRGRAYLLELIGQKDNYMGSVSWNY